jgi:tRNA A-37 threonylcarbamoyl transferase component Bud32
MNLTEEYCPGCHVPAHPAPSACGPLLEDPAVIHAVQEYRAALQAGLQPDRQALLARFPAIATALAECLDGLELVQQAAPHLQPSGAEQPVAPEVAAALHWGGPLGDYRILREVGRGGMGVVYEAEQLSLGRRVALKVLPVAAALDARQLQRFKNEAQAAARLHHTNIVPVYAVGSERGVHYYAMQFIDGHSLAALIEELRQQQRDKETGRQGDKETKTAGQTVAPETRSPRVGSVTLSPCHLVTLSSYFRTVAQLGVQAAAALEHAHGLGVVHRDIKPANLLVDARGNLWVTDFGLARLRSEPGLTQTGDLVGTARYMSRPRASRPWWITARTSTPSAPPCTSC